MARLLGWIVRNQNPWGNKGGEDKGPPDLDALFGKILRFGKKKSPSGTGGGSDGGSFWLLGIGIVIIVLILWALSGIYIVQPAEEGVILRFGKYLKTVEAGPHWFPRFIDQKYVLNVDQVNTVDLSQLMLTEKENIVDVSFIVQYQIGDIKQYLFNVVNPVDSLQQIVDSAVRQVIGHSQLDEILTTGRAKISDQVRQLIEKLVKRYKVGIVIRDVTMQPAKAPEAVKDAFDDVIKAREDQQRYINEAQSYANDITPRAQGTAARVGQEAKAYKQQVVLNAQGSIARFAALNAVYDKAPEVTSKRMYYDTLQSVLQNSRVYLVDGKGATNMFLMPSGSRSLAKFIAPGALHQSDVKRQAVASSSATSNTTSKDATKAYMRWAEAQN